MKSAIQRTVCASISVAIGDKRPRAAVLIHGARQQIAEHADRRRARRDVAEEARMAVEQRMVEQQLRGIRQQRRGIGPPSPAGRDPRRAPAGPSAAVSSGFTGPVGQPRKPVGDLIDERVAERRNCSGVMSSGRGVVIWGHRRVRRVRGVRRVRSSSRFVAFVRFVWFVRFVVFVSFVSSCPSWFVLFVVP